LQLAQAWVAQLPPVPVRLVDRSPQLSADQLAERFVPPPRFRSVRFETFDPNPDHPSQAAARTDLEALVAGLGGGGAASGRGGLFRRARPASGSAVRGRYLDGGFGVGKTHLLASSWHAAPAPKSILSFEELTAFVGFVGMQKAISTFRGHRILCIDEFELDDVANTRMAVTFLRAVVDSGTTVITTSNAVPDRLGEGRFNAEDFAREIADIASHFEVLRIDGPDFRALQHPPNSDLSTADEVARVVAAAPPGSVSVDRFDDVLAHLRKVHPVHYGALIDGLEAVVIEGVVPIENQGAALLFVQLIDEIYDAGITFAATGCPIGEIFPDSYRRGGYRKKYGRCESRLNALIAEARPGSSATGAG
jgi:cell division protein ZapE